MSDQALLDRSLARLKATGAIEYTGEYGAEITTFIPFAFWLKTQGLLAGRRVITYEGMRPYYYFLDEDEYGEKPGPRHWIPTGERGWPTNSTYTATRQPWHVMPDYRARYAGQGKTFERPVLFIQNKFAVEWEIGPINFLPIMVLQGLFEFMSDRFDIVYSRPGAAPMGVDYTPDLNIHCDYPDMAAARGFSSVLVLEDYCAETGAPYNLTKLEILAKSHLFVATQGGGAHLLACFGRSVMLLLHCDGEEYPHAYASGPYKYLADPPPVLLVARTHRQLYPGVNLILTTRVEDGEMVFDPAHQAAFDALKV